MLLLGTVYILFLSYITCSPACRPRSIGHTEFLALFKRRKKNKQSKNFREQKVAFEAKKSFEARTQSLPQSPVVAF